MGIDYNAELIIGFSLDTDKVKEWCNKQCEDIDDGDINELNKLIEEKYKLPEKIYKEGNNISSSFRAGLQNQPDASVTQFHPLSGARGR